MSIQFTSAVHICACGPSFEMLDKAPVDADVYNIQVVPYVIYNGLRFYNHPNNVLDKTYCSSIYCVGSCEDPRRLDYNVCHLVRLGTR